MKFWQRISVVVPKSSDEEMEKWYSYSSARSTSSAPPTYDEMSVAASHPPAPFKGGLFCYCCWADISIIEKLVRYKYRLQPPLSLLIKGGEFC